MRAAGPDAMDALLQPGAGSSIDAADHGQD
jgi:hypothetical protein